MMLCFPFTRDWMFMIRDNIWKNDCSRKQRPPTIYNGYNKYKRPDGSSIFLLTNQREWEWRKLVTVTFVKLVLEFHPVKPQCMKECTQSLHDKQDTNRGTYEDNDTNNKDDRIVKPTRTKHDNFRGSGWKGWRARWRESLLTPTLAWELYHKIH